MIFCEHATLKPFCTFPWFLPAIRPRDLENQSGSEDTVSAIAGQVPEISTIAGNFLQLENPHLSAGQCIFLRECASFCKETPIFPQGFVVFLGA